MKRIEIEDYPLRAIREAIVNDIIHRDYQMTGSEIHIDIFDDRLEITSPGGMLDGSFVQSLDITKISSMRRNRVISDIFNRLHFMERRGSGLIRIIESYRSFHKSPIFYSDISSFKVTFPNRSYIPIYRTIKSNKNMVSDEDYFIIKLHKNLTGKVRNQTFTQIYKLFELFSYQFDFKRENIEEVLQIKKSRASDILGLLLDYDLIEPTEPTRYKFKK